MLVAFYSLININIFLKQQYSNNFLQKNSHTGCFIKYVERSYGSYKQVGLVTKQFEDWDKKIYNTSSVHLYTIIH